MARVHDYPSSFPYLTLTHIHTDACCGLDELTGKPRFVCDLEYNACTTCMAMGATAAEMKECVHFRRDKARRDGKDERKRSTVGCF